MTGEHDHNRQVREYGECITCATARRAGPEARNVSLARVAANTPADWAAAARDAVRRVARTNLELTSDDLWPLVPEIDEPRALGPILVWAASQKLIEATDRTRPSTRTEAHARPVRVWRSLVFEPPAMF